MSKFLFANNALSTLAGGITNTATTANLATGTGVLFPAPSGGDFFTLTFNDAATGLLEEIVHVTNVTGDVITMVRAQEGSTALNWAAGDSASNLCTAGSMQAFMQTSVSGGGRLLQTFPVALSGGIALPAGTSFIRVRGCGAGGGSGAVPVTDASHAAASGGAGSGAWGEFLVTAGLASLVATIGAGGIAGVDGVSAGVGGNGGNTVLTGTFGTITFPGGMGSAEGALVTTVATQGGGQGGNPPTSSGATPVFTSAGQIGGPTLVVSLVDAYSGMGGSTPYGAGGSSNGGTGTGTIGNGAGAGAGGALNLASAITHNGAAGTPGLLIVEAYS